MQPQNDEAHTRGEERRSGEAEHDTASAVHLAASQKGYQKNEEQTRVYDRNERPQHIDCGSR